MAEGAALGVSGARAAEVAFSPLPVDWPSRGFPDVSLSAELFLGFEHANKSAPSASTSPHRWSAVPFIRGIYPRRGRSVERSDGPRAACAVELDARL